MNGRAGGTAPDVLCSKVPCRWTGDIGPESAEGGGAEVFTVGGEMGLEGGSAMLNYVLVRVLSLGAVERRFA